MAGLLTARARHGRLPRPAAPAGPVGAGRSAWSARRPGHVELHDGAGLLADGVAADVLLDVPRPSRRTRREPLRGASPGAAVTRSPDASAAGPSTRTGCGSSPGRCSDAASSPRSGCRRSSSPTLRGALPPELVCAALDCPQLWALMLHAPAATSDRVVTAVLETRLEQPVRAGRAARRHGLAASAATDAAGSPAPRSSDRPASSAPPDGRRRPSSRAGACPSAATTGRRAGCARVAARRTLASTMAGRAAVAILVADGEPLAFASVGAALAHAAGAAARPPGRHRGRAASRRPGRSPPRLRAAAEPGQILVSDLARWAEPRRPRVPRRRPGRARRGPASDRRVGAAVGGAGAADAGPAVRRARCSRSTASRSRRPAARPPRCSRSCSRARSSAADRAELIDVLWPHRRAARPAGRAAAAPLAPAPGARRRRRSRAASASGCVSPRPVWTDVGEAAARARRRRATAAKAEDWARTRAHARGGARPAATRVPPWARRRVGPRPPARDRGARAGGARVDRPRVARARRRRARRRRSAPPAS